MASRRRSRGNDDAGAAAVEFALVSPLLLILLFGMINWGVVLSQQIAMNNAVRDAARSAVVPGGVASTGLTCQQVVDQTRSSMSALNTSSAKLAVTVSRNGATLCAAAASVATVASGGSTLPCQGATAATGNVTVKATYQANMLVPIIPPSSMALTSTGYFACEYT